MATLVLSTIGNALGGPVGGAIGALIGQSIDQQLLGPSTRGPRLGDLKVQSSSYGTQIPRIYGTMRVAGSVIWATDLVESSEMSGAKGQPDTMYSYSVSFAVALSSRVVQSVGRIWADGKLLRGADGDFKVSTKFRLCPGGEDQEIDPLIASVEGLTSTPAYRGLALAVFEDLELGDYGNRIPFLTFEVVAENDPSLGQVLNDASGGAINSGDARAIAGFAAYGQCVKAAVQPLVDTFAIELADDGARLVSPAALVTDIVNDELGNSSNGQVAARYQREQLPARSLPAILRLGYYDAALDYQSGEARAMSAERRGIEEQIDLPAVLSAGDAKSLAQAVIAREWAQRDKLTLRLPPKYIGLQPGSLVALDLSPVVWRVEQCTIDSFVAVVELRPSWRSEAWLAGDSGRIIANVDEPVGAINLALFDVPDVLQLGSDTPTLLLASSAASGAWKARSVEIVAGEQSFATTTARRRSVLGRALTSLDDGSADLIDEENAFDVELIDPEQWLVSCDDDGLVAGSNLALLGSEVLQFGRAEPLGEGRFRLSRLVRGRVGTEWAVGTHAAGEFFVLIQPDSLRAVRLPYWTIGSSVTANVTGVAGTSSSGPVTVTGESLRPPSPVSVDAAVDPDGSLSLAWTRRSRKGFAWIDEIDAPLGESSELYRVTITGNANSIERVTNEPALLVAASELAVAGAGPITIEVRQIGDAAASRPAARTLTFPTGASQ